MNSWKKLAQKTRVPAGTALGVVFLIRMLFYIQPSAKSLWIGGIMALCGAFLRLWASGHIEKGRVLTQGGPYAFTRNPLYLGSFFMAIGIIIAGQEYWLLPCIVLFFLGFYYPVMKAEEQELLNGYGNRFVEYTKRVPMFFPSFRKSETGLSRFSWSRVFKNREHQTLSGLILAVAFLIIIRQIR